MSIRSLTYQQRIFKRYHTDKHFSEFSPTRRRQKSTDIDMEQIYVTVTLCILRRSCFWHCYTVYAQKLHLKRVKVNLNWELTLKFHKYAKALCSTKSTVGLFFNFTATKRAVRPIKSKSQRFTFIVLVKRQKGVIFWYVSDRQTVRCCEHCLRHLSLSTATSYDITLTRIRIAQWKPNYSHYVKKSIKRQGELENSSHSVVDHAHISTHQTSRKQRLGGWLRYYSASVRPIARYSETAACVAKTLALWLARRPLRACCWFASPVTRLIPRTTSAHGVRRRPPAAAAAAGDSVW